jgi:hypothetical protein
MIARAAERAVARAIDRLEAAAADALPGDVAVERTNDGLRLTGRRLRLRWLTDARLRDFALLAGRGR